MEVFLIVSLPRRRKHNRLKLVIKRLPQSLLAADVMPGTVGAGFWPVGLYLLRPISHHGKVSRCNLATFVEQHQHYHMWDGPFDNWLQEFLDSMGFRWDVTHSTTHPPSKSGMMRPQLLCDKTQPSAKWRFQFGRGTVFESLPDDRHDLIEHLDRLLAAHPKLHGCDFSVQYHEGTHTLVLASSDAGRRESWTVDLKTWTLIPSHDPEDWCSCRLSGVLKDPENSITQYVGFVKDLSTGTILQLTLLFNLLAELGAGRLDATWVDITKATAHEVVKWLRATEKFVIDPLDEVLQQHKYMSLLEPHSIDSILASPAGTRSLGSNSFRELVEFLPTQIHSIKQNPSTQSDFDWQNLDDIINSVVILGIHGWTECVARNQIASRSLLRRLKQMGKSAMSVEVTNLRSPFDLDLLRALHTGLSQFVQGPLRGSLAGYGHTLFTPTPGGQMRSIPGVDGMEVLWSTLTRSGVLYVHTKSRAEPLNQSLMQISQTGEVVSHSFPTSLLQNFCLDCPYFTPFKFLTPSSIWIIDNQKSQALRILRIDLNPTKYHQFSQLQVKIIDKPSATWVEGLSFAVFDDRLVIVDPNTGKDNPQILLGLTFVRIEGVDQLLTEEAPLVDNSCPSLIQKFLHTVPHQGYLTPNITRGTRQSQFLSLRYLVASDGQHETSTDTLVALSLFEWDFQMKEYKLLIFNSWRLSVIVSKYPRAEFCRLSTFKIHQAEYFLSCTQGDRLLIHFTTNRMSMVLVGGSQIHRLPQQLGEPIQELGVDSKYPELLYAKQTNHLFRSRPQFSIFLLKYVMD